MIDKNKYDELIMYGTIKVSDKGQIALPVDLRNAIDLKRGDYLLVVRKKNSNNFTLMPMDDIMLHVRDFDDFYISKKS
jgi:AbrB family looped-hinge helix DNA binding protein